MASRFAEILVALANKVAEVVPDENAIIITARRELPRLVGDYDVLLRIRNMRDTEGTTAAAGRYAMFVRRYVDVIIRSRQFADISKQDMQWLVDETNGILDLELRLIDCLQMWHPEIGVIEGTPPIVGNNPHMLLIENARVILGDEPLRDIPGGRTGNVDPNVGMLSFRLDLYYEEVLNQAIQ